jgi:hypothetical protein
MTKQIILMLAILAGLWIMSPGCDKAKPIDFIFKPSTGKEKLNFILDINNGGPGLSRDDPWAYKECPITKQYKGHNLSRDGLTGICYSDIAPRTAIQVKTQAGLIMWAFDKYDSVKWKKHNPPQWPDYSGIIWSQSGTLTYTMPNISLEIGKPGQILKWSFIRLI